MNLRKITALTMLISFVFCVLTSVILYIVPHGRIANWSGWSLWQLSKTQWSDLHTNLGILFLLVCFLHLYYNWKPITAYLKDKTKTLKVFTINFNIAFLLTLAFGLGTYFHIPPMSTILDIGESIKDASAVKYGEPPYGHAELSSLKMFAKRVNLDLDKSIQLLQDAGIRYENEKMTIGEIAKENTLSPKQVYEIITPAKKRNNTGTHSVFPDSPPPGFGRKKLAEVCVDFNLHIPDIVHALSSKGVKAEPTHSIKEIATKNNTEMMTIFEIIRDTINGS